MPGLVRSRVLLMWLTLAATLASCTAKAQPVSVPSSPVPIRTEECSTPLLDELERRLGGADVKTGLLADTAAQQLIGQICGDASVKAALPHTCAGELTSPLMPSLRRALLLDLAGLGRRALADARRRDAARLAVAVAETALGEASVEYFVERLLDDGTAPAPLCRQGIDPSALPQPPPSDVPQHAALLIAEVLSAYRTVRQQVSATRATAEQTRAGAEALPDEVVARIRARVEAAVVARLRAARLMAVGQLGAVRRQALDAVIRHVADLEGAARAAASADGVPDTFDPLVVPLLGTVDATYALLFDAQLKTVNVAARVRPVLDALKAGSPEAYLAAAARAWAQGVGAEAATRGTSDFEASDDLAAAVGCALRFARARDDGARRRAAAACILGTPLWAEPIIFDANLGVAAVDFDNGNYQIAGSATLGYNGGDWGVVARGRGAAYDVVLGGDIRQTDFITGDVEGWYAGNVSRRWKLEGRLAAGGTFLGSLTRDAATRTTIDEFNILVTGAVFGGARYQAANLAFGVWAGGGGQYEIYDPVISTPGAGNTSVSQQDEVGYNAQGRLRFKWLPVPQIVAVRVSSDLLFFNLARSVYDAINDTTTTLESTSLSVASRAYLDLEAARFFDFVPSIGGGADVVSFSDDASSDTTVVPIFTAGIRRETF